MREEFSRAALLLGEEALQRLGKAHVAVFGVGGVGSFCCEALARAGIGSLSLFDSDTVARSNINRQIIALQSTVGRPKTEVMAERISDINPAAAVVSHPVFYTAKQIVRYRRNADSIRNDHVKINRDLIVLNLHAQASFQAVPFQKAHQSILYIDNCHSDNSETLNSNTPRIRGDHIRVNYD